MVLATTSGVAGIEVIQAVPVAAQNASASVSAPLPALKAPTTIAVSKLPGPAGAIAKTAENLVSGLPVAGALSNLPIKLG